MEANYGAILHLWSNPPVSVSCSSTWSCNFFFWISHFFFWISRAAGPGLAAVRQSTPTGRLAAVLVSVIRLFQCSSLMSRRKAFACSEEKLCMIPARSPWHYQLAYASRGPSELKFQLSKDRMARRNGPVAWYSEAVFSSAKFPKFFTYITSNFMIFAWSIKYS